MTDQTTKPPAIMQALEGIRGTIGELETKREALRVELAAADLELRQLRTAERALDPKPRVAGASTSGRTTTADAVRAIMTELKTATQHQVAEALGKPKNTAKHALIKLEGEGFVRRTGKAPNRSPEFELVEAADAA